jgi:transcriptional antiterminator RfaH
MSISLYGSSLGAIDESDSSVMSWYVIHTKPKQEFRAKENLQNQSFRVFLPTIPKQALRQKHVRTIEEPLFARYLFIELDQVSSNWFSIRSTRGVHQLVRFGVHNDPVRVPEQWMAELQQMCTQEHTPQALFTEGDTVKIIGGPFQGLEARFAHLLEDSSGESRAMVLLEMLGKWQTMQLGLVDIKKATS